MGQTQACLLMCIQGTRRFFESKEGSMGQFALTKAFTTKMAREAASIARESLGGNGILLDNYVMKALLDNEVLWTGEGTFDINLMVIGRELTGKNAFNRLKAKKI